MKLIKLPRPPQYLVIQVQVRPQALAWQFWARVIDKRKYYTWCRVPSTPSFIFPNSLGICLGPSSRPTRCFRVSRVLRPRRLAVFESLSFRLAPNSTRCNPWRLLSCPLISAHRNPLPAPSAHFDISLSSSAPDLSSLDSLSRQNPRRPTQFAGDYPAGRTWGFNFKIASDPLSTRNTTSSIVSFEPTALPSASSLWRSNPQDGAVPSWAALTQLQTASSSAADDAFPIGRGSVVPAPSGHHGSGALPRTPIEPRDMHDFPGGGYQRSNPGGFSPARQVHDFFPRPRTHHSFDSIPDQCRHAADQNFIAVSDTHQPMGALRDTQAFPSATPRPRGESPSRTTSPDRVQMRLDAMYAEERRVDAILKQCSAIF